MFAVGCSSQRRHNTTQCTQYRGGATENVHLLMIDLLPSTEFIVESDEATFAFCFNVLFCGSEFVIMALKYDAFSLFYVYFYHSVMNARGN